MQLLTTFSFTLLLATAFAAPSTTPKSTSTSSHPSKAPLCSTPGCKEVAGIFKNAMNSTVDPCVDFYQYACGGWVSSHPIPDWKSRTGVTEELEDVQTAQVKKLLEAFDLKKNEKKASASVSLAAYFYQSCVKLGSEAKEVGVKALKEVISTIRSSRDWKLGQKVKPEEEKTMPKWEESLVRLFSQGAIDAVFSVSVSPDPKNVSSLIINLDPAGLGMPENDLANLTRNVKLVNAYRKLIGQTAQILCPVGKCTAHDINSDIEEIVQLESDFAKALMPLEDRRNPEKTYNKLTLTELAKRTKFDWLKKYLLPLWTALGVEHTAAIDGSTTVLVSDLQYLEKVVAILEKTSARVVDNYMGWLAADEYSDLASEAFRDLAFDFIKVSQGVTKRVDRDRACLSAVNGVLTWSIGRIFVDNYFSVREKQEAAAIIDEVQKAFIELLQKNSWLDEQTRAASISKLQHVRKNVAYPNWLLDNRQLDEYHGLTNPTQVKTLLASSNYVQSYVSFSVLSVKSTLEELHKPINVDKNWPMGPFIVNAAYEPEQNSITIPAGQLKSPFYNSDFPFAVNYGDIGATVGHEFTHGLDDEGRQFDQNGNLHPWWNDDAIDKFTNRTECFVKQYSGQLDKTTGLHLNGQNTLGENLADNGGLGEAYLAFKNVESQKGASPVLADLPHLTADQLFFISYGFSWCSAFRPEALRSQIEYNVHSPAMYRVNVPVSNSQDFARAFKCPVGSPMNPTKKCLLW